MTLRFILIVAVLASAGVRLSADETLYRYEGNVAPHDKSAGWIVANPCEEPCTESVEDGHYVLRWTRPNDIVNYALLIALPPAPPRRRIGSSGASDPTAPSYRVPIRATVDFRLVMTT